MSRRRRRLAVNSDAHPAVASRCRCRSRRRRSVAPFSLASAADRNVCCVHTTEPVEPPSGIRRVAAVIRLILLGIDDGNAKSVLDIADRTGCYFLPLDGGNITLCTVQLSNVIRCKLFQTRLFVYSADHRVTCVVARQHSQQQRRQLLYPSATRMRAP